MRICILGSGSSGNATLVVAGETRVLLDCGLSAKETIRRIASVGEDPARLDAVVVTHEHSDHARGLYALSRALDLPVYISDRTFDACRLGERAGRVRRGHAIRASEDFEIGSMLFSPFAIPHDAVDPLAFTVSAGGAKMGMAVDLGHINREAARRFRGSDALIIEANHDIDMLKVCRVYSWELKRRINSNRGHTSNDEMARFLGEDFDNKAEYIVLAHLSQNTNNPELAFLAAAQALEGRSPLFSFDAGRRVRIAAYDRPSDWIEL